MNTPRYSYYCGDGVGAGRGPITGVFLVFSAVRGE